MNRVNRILNPDFFRVCLFLVCCTGLAPYARAADEFSPNEGLGVALAINLPDAGPRHREMAAGIVSEAQRRWAMLEPQLTHEAVAACADEEKCLVGLAKKQNASHLLSVGIAALDRMDFVVSVKLVELKSGRELVSHADIGKPGFRPLESGINLAKILFDSLPDEGQPASAQSQIRSQTNPNSMSWKATTGWTFAATAPIVAGSAAAFWVSSEDEAAKTVVAISGGVATALLGCVSVGLFLWDGLE